MTRIVYATATSLDGYIADPDNSLDWLFAVEGGDDAIAELEPLMATTTVQVEGSTTYLWIVEQENLLANPAKWQELYGSKKTFVFSSRGDLPLVPGADIEVLNGPVSTHIERIIAAAEGGDVHLVGGGALAAEFAQIGHLDALHLSIAPVTLGAGAPLLAGRLDSTRLRLTRLHQTGQFVQAEYDLLSAD